MIRLLADPTTLVALAIFSLAAVHALRLMPQSARDQIGELLGMWTFLIVGVIAPLVLVLVFVWLMSLLTNLMDG